MVVYKGKVCCTVVSDDFSIGKSLVIQIFWHREGNTLTNGDLLCNVNAHYIGVTSTLFSELLLCLLFLQIINSK